MTKAKDNFLINIEDYDIVEKISHGGFGRIDLVRNKKTRKEFVSKTNLIPNNRANKLFISREVRILIQIQHPTIIQFRGYSYLDFYGEKNITILMDYMKKGSLANLISNNERSLCPSNFDNTKRQIILIGIARGMMVLHDKYVIHRDLKPENILLDCELRPRITDFGLSKFFDPHNSMYQSISDAGTSAYMSPEVFSTDHFNTKADVYSFGILMYEIVAGKRAYQDVLIGPQKITNFSFKKKVQEGLRPQFDFPIKKGLQRMIEQCWTDNPKERPTFKELFNKLSLSVEDFFFEFESNNFEPKIKIEQEDEQIEEDEFGMIINKTYCLDDVDVSDVLEYVEAIKEEPKSLKSENIEMKQEMTKMASEIESLKNELESIKKEKDAEITSLKKELDSLKKEKEASHNSKKLIEQFEAIEKTVRNQTAEIKSIKTKHDSNPSNSEAATTISQQFESINKMLKEQAFQISSIQRKFGNFFTVEPSLTATGIIGHLHDQQASPFDRLFVASQSSGDIYSLLVPDTSDYFGNNSTDDFYIKFDLKDSVTINGIRIYSWTQDFPRSFDISINDEKVKSITDATELNGANKKMTIDITPTECKTLKFTRTGERSAIHIKGIELLSPDPKYSKGVFSTFVEKSENKDPHKCPVIIYAKWFDLNNFHLIDAKHNISTYENDKNSWFQIELTKGLAVLTGFRLRKTRTGKMKSYRIVSTDDSNKPDELWTKLIEINEESKNENKVLDVYEFPHPSPPARFVKIISIAPNWSDNWRLVFLHFDLFGSYW